MHDRPTMARGYEIVARWSALAERRLAALIELYESGRWQRYHDEAEFRAMMREAVAAVETWRKLVAANGASHAAPADIATMLPPPFREINRPE